MKESEVFRLTIFRDNATTLRAPFINMLEVGVHNEAGSFEIADCAGYVAKGFKKDAECIAKFLAPRMERIDPEKKQDVLFNAFDFFLSSYYYCKFPISSSKFHIHILGLACMYLMVHPMPRRIGTPCLSNFLELHASMGQNMLHTSSLMMCSNYKSSTCL